MNPDRLQWWTWYIAALVLIVTLQPILINFIPYYSIETGIDWIVAALCIFLLPTTLVAIAYWARGTRPAGVKLVAAIAGLACAIVLIIVGLKTDDKALNINTCKFGWLTFGEVWIKVEPVDPKPPRDYKLHIDWGPVWLENKYKLEDVRYFTLEKRNPFSNVQLGVEITPDAHLTCGASHIPSHEDQTALRGWYRR